ncbi:conjugal transfer protein TrbC (plasmid) [Zophobihabitans entericus]|uniref:Conjugal transfer protein TrbC n=1 Tax=Zophobihabitans entericus TaxID=1635327 RepID=A0A6G9IE83_9GAMM|nr:conjugal transfer protein TrbC [Zophobihabitans entericus]
MYFSKTTVFEKDSIIFKLLCALFFYILLTQCAAASEGSGGGLPYEGWLGKLKDSLTGPVAFAVSIIGIVVAGSTLIFGGELNAFFKTLVYLILVMSFLVGANNLLSGFFGRGADLFEMQEDVIDFLKNVLRNIVNE